MLPKWFSEGGKGADQQLPPPSLKGIRKVRETNSRRLLVKLKNNLKINAQKYMEKKKIVNPLQLRKNNTIKRPVQDVISF